METVTFRIDTILKTALAGVAAEESKPIGEWLREMVRERVEQKKRREFETEARRQSREAAGAAAQPQSDAAAALHELDIDLEEFRDEWQ